MHLEYTAWIVANIMAAALRWVMLTGAHVVASQDVGTLVRLLPVFMLPFSVLRLAIRRRAGLAVLIAGMDYYFLFNRLTVFSVKPLALAELVGNVCIIGLALVLMLPQRVDKKEMAKRA